MSRAKQNWATNIQFSSSRVHAPETVEELQSEVRRAAKVKAVGSCHSFNGIADTDGTLISLERLETSIAIDRVGHTATVNADITYSELCPLLDREGYALRNMASLPHITVAGACATATHGSGDANGNLATEVAALELVKADGELVQLLREQHDDSFAGMVVSMGSLGIVTKITLDLIPAYTMQQQVYENLPWQALENYFDEIMASGYSVSLFIDWRKDSINQVWVKQILPDKEAAPVESDFFGASLATGDRNPVDDRPAVSCTTQRGLPGPWYERLPHFHIRSTLTGGGELQSEYFVPREVAVEALLTVNALRDQMTSFLLLCEVRSVAADELWMSPAYARDCIGIHFSWYNRWDEVSRFLPLLEARLAPFQARPHWGKLFTTSAEQLRNLYPRLPDFQTLLNTCDPQQKFGNSFLSQVLQK